MDEEIKVKYREEQTRLLKIITAFAKLEGSEEWAVLKELVFNVSLGAIERQLLNESLNQTIDPNKLYKLQGEWVWAKQFCDTGRFIEQLKKQLEELKKKLR